jgi:NTP pyrophosphatase (non-canonical NTP hydrolase)
MDANEVEMNFDEYQEMAKSTAIYPEQAQIVYPSLGVASEAGEVAGTVKKWIRDDRSAVMGIERQQKLTKEIGDTLWYLANLCTDIGVSLERVARENIEKLQSRQDRGVLEGDGDER